MAKKEKKPLTVKQTKNKYRALQYTTFGGEFVAILTPYIALGIANFDEWFVNNPESWKLGLGGALSLALLGMAIFLVGKKKEDKNITGGYITLILGWFAVAFIFLLLGSIIDQIATIMMFGGLGLMGAFGLDLTSKSFKKKADLYKKALDEVNGKVLEQDILEELKQKAKQEKEEYTSVD